MHREISYTGAFLIATAVEVTTDSTFSFTWDEIKDCIDNISLIGVVVFYELTLRLILMLTKNNGKPRYPLIAPAFYLAITPTFYVGLWLLGLDKREADNAGYFFPAMEVGEPENGIGMGNSESGSILTSAFNKDLFDIWRVLNFSTVCVPIISLLLCLSPFTILTFHSSLLTWIFPQFMDSCL